MSSGAGRLGRTAHPGGALVVSLDFELFWGNRDHRTLADCRRSLSATREVVPKILRLFRAHEVHATWATVGLLFCDDRREALRFSPDLRPTYADPNLSPYRHLESLQDEDAAFHFAPDLVRLIASTPHQEVGTHTFSHFYCLEPGQTLEQFRADLDAAQRVAREKLQQELVSIVFPRNQFSPESLGVCRQVGVHAFRGNEANSWSGATTRGGERRGVRALRLLDHYLPISGHATSEPEARAELPVDIPSSRFLRGYSTRLAALEPLRLARITGAMRYAARHRRVFHLWWHPENFGTYPEQNLEMLQRILKVFGDLRRAHRMRSVSMGELAREAGAAATHDPSSPLRDEAAQRR